MRKIVIIACILLLPVLLTQCESVVRLRELRDWFSARGSEEVLVGAAWPFESNKDGLDEGLLLAQEEINARGVRGRRIQLILRDDRLDRERSRAIALEFARNPRMAATIGYYDDTFAVRASAIFEEAGLLHIVAGANNTYMTTHGFRYLIRSVLSNDRIGRSLANLCLDRGYRRFAIIAEEGPFGEDLTYQTGIQLDARDARVAYRASYVRGRSEFRRLVDELKEVAADAVLFLGLETESARFIKSARGMGLRTPIVGSFSDTPEVRAIAGAALEGVMTWDIYDVDSPTPENRAFVGKFRRRFGRDPEAYAAQGYDALHILAKAIETTGSTNSLDLAYGIRDLDRFEGANGPYKFDSTGEMQDKSLIFKIYRGGSPVVLATSQPSDEISNPER